MPRVATITRASVAVLREQLATVEAARKQASAAESWSAVASLMRQETELRIRLEEVSGADTPDVGTMTEADIVERLALALARLPAVIRDDVFERVATMGGAIA